MTAPWDAPESLPLKPEGPEYGFFSKGKVYACTRDDLVVETSRPSTGINLVWTPESPRFVTAWEVPFLAGPLRERTRHVLGQRAKLAGLVFLFLAYLAATRWSSREFPVYAAMAVFMALVPLIQFLRARRRLSAGYLDASGTARLTRFMLWTRRRPQHAAWILATALAAAAIWQIFAGLERSFVSAAHVKEWVAHEPWRLLTGGLIHAGFLHFALNVFALITLGRLVESLAGRFHVFLVFFVSILCGSVASQFLGSAPVSVGASGGILGLLGFIAAFALRRRGALPAPIRKWLVMMILGVVVLGVAASGMIDNAAHAGGFLGGGLLGLLVMASKSSDIPVRNGKWIAFAGGLALGLIVLATLALPLISRARFAHERPEATMGGGRRIPPQA